MLFVPHERGASAGKVDKWASNGQVALDPDAHVASDTEKGTDVGEVLAVGPVPDLGNLGVIRDVPFIVAFVSKDDNFGDGNEELLCRDGGTGTEESMEYVVDVVQMLPNEAADLVVSWNHFVPSVT